MNSRDENDKGPDCKGVIEDCPFKMRHIPNMVVIEGMIIPNIPAKKQSLGCKMCAEVLENESDP